MRITRLGLLLLVYVLWATCLPAQEPSAKFNCGLNAAYIYLKRSGHYVPYQQLVREFQAQSPPDSMLAIRNVLEKHGCQTEGIKTDADFFLSETSPAIVYLELDGYSLNGERHFSYLVRASRDKGVELRDPIFEMNKTGFMAWDTFTRMFKGIALIAHE